MSRPDREYLPTDVDQRGKRSAKHKQLVSRWQTPEGRALADQITVRILTGKKLERIRGIGRIDGRVDLRGFGFPAVERLTKFRLRHPERFRSGPYIILNKIHWSGLDFSHGRLGAIQFYDSRIEDCVFDDAYCEDWKVWRTRVSDSRFVRANLRGSVIGAYSEGKGNSWARVSFDRTDLRGAVLHGSTFTDVQFTSIHTGAFDGFHRCKFERVTFSGQLRHLQFDMTHRPADEEPDPGPMKDSDFSTANLGQVSFRGVVFDNVRFPADFDLQSHVVD